MLTIDRTDELNETALSQQGDGVVWNVSKNYKSGWVDSFNKMWWVRLQAGGNTLLPCAHVHHHLTPARNAGPKLKLVLGMAWQARVCDILHSTSFCAPA